MHIAISWDIKAEGEEWKKADDALKAKIQPYSWVRPLSTFYILKVDSAASRDAIIADLQAVAKSLTTTIHFVATPLMQGGRYNGWLPKDLWTQIRERTDT